MPRRSSAPTLSLIVSKDSEIERLKKEVEDAKREAYEAKTSTHAKLDKDLRLERMANALKGQKRSRHFDEWRNEHIVAWFLEMDLEEYVPAVLASKVDGLLLLNMDEDDFRELGITKRLHQRKIDIALKKYKLRYERRKPAATTTLTSRPKKSTATWTSPTKVVQKKAIRTATTKKRRRRRRRLWKTATTCCRRRRSCSS